MTPALSTRSSMAWRTCGQCLRRQSPAFLRSSGSGPRPLHHPRHLSTTHPLRTTANPLRNSGNVRNREQEVAQSRRSMVLSAAGIAVCAVAMFGVIKLDLFGLEQQQQLQGQQDNHGSAGGNNNNNNNNNKRNGTTMKLDGPDGFTGSPSVIRIQGQDGVEQVETGTSSVPLFPSTIRLPRSIDAAGLKSGDEVVSKDGEGGGEEEEYQLLGLGVRTVSFLKIQVYVVGLYVARSDISELQRRLVHTAVSPPLPVDGEKTQIISNAVGATSATSLVSTERARLKELLLDPEQGDGAWDAILREDGLRTVFRIVPTRNTDFLHLRDGWVRGITGRAQRANATAKGKEGGEGGAATGEFQDDSFGAALNDFKSLFGGGQRKNVPKGQTLYLVRNARGELDALFHPDAKKPMRFLGRVADERISRLVWLNYLAGKNVSSEGARQSVVDGLMGIVERPVGTLVQKVL